MANSYDNIKKYATSFIGFDEFSGDVYDNIGNTAGTIYNTPTRVTGWNGEGYAMSFNGTNEYVQMNNPIIPLRNKTIRFKFKKNSNTVYDNDVLLCTSGTSDNTHNGFYLTMVNNIIGFYVVHGGVSVPYSSNIPITDTDWHDFALTVDGNVIKIYVDGVLTAEYDNYSETFTTQKYNLYIASYHVLGSYNFNGTIDSLEFYDRVISIISDKYLVLHNNEYKYHDGTQWQVTTNTEENFIQFGMEQLSQITEAQWQELTGDISVVMWSDFEDKEYVNVVLERDEFTPKDLLGEEYTVVVMNDEDVETQKLFLDAVGQSQEVFPLNDISLFGIREITSLTATGSGSGKIAISVDSGATWNTFGGSSWSSITNISQGMDFTTFNSLTDAQLKALLGESKFIRFAYYLTGDTEFTNVLMKVKTQGTPEFANKDDYTMSYDLLTQTITYEINKSGHFIINYNNS